MAQTLIRACNNKSRELRSVRNIPKLDYDLGVYFSHITKSEMYWNLVSQANDCL